MSGKHARLRPRWVKAGLGALGGISVAGAVFLMPPHLHHVQPLTPLGTPATSPGTQYLAETPQPPPALASRSSVESRILEHTPTRTALTTATTPLLVPPVPASVTRAPVPAPGITATSTPGLLLVPPPAPVTSPARVPSPSTSASPSASVTPSPSSSETHRHRHHRHRRVYDEYPWWSPWWSPTTSTPSP
jgi:hypothetical protein